MTSASSRIVPGTTKPVRYLLLLIFCLGLVTFPVWVPEISDRFSEASPRAYADIALVPSICPPLATAAKTALSDGILTRHEAISLGRSLSQMAAAYDTAKAMRSAKARLNLPQPTLPPACSNMRPDHDYTSGAVLDPLWLR